MMVGRSKLFLIFYLANEFYLFPLKWKTFFLDINYIFFILQSKKLRVVKSTIFVVWKFSFSGAFFMLDCDIAV